VNCCNKNQIKGVEQLFIDTLPEGYEPFTEYIVRPERKDMKTGETIPADVRKLPNLFMKWELQAERPVLETSPLRQTERSADFESENNVNALTRDSQINPAGRFHEDGTQHWIPHFVTYDSKHQYRSLKPDKYNQNCHKVRDENRKVCSISTSKLPKPV
jgi:hypothetical protein